MLDILLLPDTDLLRLGDCRVDGENLILTIFPTNSWANCPQCGNQSNRIHSRYQRSLRDLACAGRRVWLHWQVRRFFCDEPLCPKLTFTEQHPDIAPCHARQTKRLLEQKRSIALELSGEAGRRISQKLAIPMSGDQALILVRSIPERGEEDPPKVIGVDDWAYRKGQIYGTILVDLEKHRVIDLLPDREAETLAAWLKEHPGIEIISRDRSQQYIQGIQKGAPQAVQVADRFHLLQNLGDVLKKTLDGCPQELQQARKLIVEALTEQNQTVQNDTFVERGSLPKESETTGSKTLESTACQSTTYAQERFSAVKKLQSQGLSQREIARQLHLGRPTVKKYCSLTELPRRASGVNTLSKTASFMPYLAVRWQEGCHSRLKLFQEIQEQGFDGSYSSVWRALNQFPDQSALGAGSVLQAQFALSPRQAAWLLMTRPANLKPDQIVAYPLLCQASQTSSKLAGLVRNFCEMVRNRDAEKLDAWLTFASKCKIPEFERFAVSLRSDYDAVLAALSHKWSNGQTEGQVHRLKLIKRQMYGRASFDLLRCKVIGNYDTS